MLFEAILGEFLLGDCDRFGIGRSKQGSEELLRFFMLGRLTLNRFDLDLFLPRVDKLRSLFVLTILCQRHLGSCSRKTREVLLLL
jgi:hypothetical protein